MDDRKRRLASFSKRQNVLLKKARELTVQCDAEVGVIVFSPEGELSHFPYRSGLEKTIQHFTRVLDAERSCKSNAFQVQGQDVEPADGVKQHGAPESGQWALGSGNTDQINVNELMKLEEKLQSTLRKVRSRKIALLKDSVTTFHMQEKALVNENHLLPSAVGEDVVVEDEPVDSEASAGRSSDAAKQPPT